MKGVVNIKMSAVCRNLLALLLFLFVSDRLFAQDPAPAKADSVKTPKKAEKLTAVFDTTVTWIQEGEVFSKGLRVVSNIDAPLTFRVDVSFPAEWKSLVNPKKTHSINGRDTLFIPIRLIPLGKVKGNTKYMINAYLFDTIGAPISSAYVQASRPKLAKWSLNIGPNRKIYFKNDSNEANFTVKVGNEGSEPQEIYLNMTNIRKDIILMDTSGKILKNPDKSFTIREFGDTTLHYGVKIHSASRNMRRVDTEGYKLGILTETKTYSLFVRSSETSLLGKNARSIVQKVDFVKLPNYQKISPYGMYALPMVMDFNMSNLFSNLPTAYLYFHGSAGLDNGAILTYNTQFVGSFGVFGGSTFAPPFFVIGYHTGKFSINAGNVGGSGGGIGVGGRGVNGTYRINNRNVVGGFITIGPSFFKGNKTYGFGINHRYSLHKFYVNSGYTHVTNDINIGNLVFNNFSLNSGYTFSHNHTVSFGGTFSLNSYADTSRSGYTLRGGYAGSFFKSKLRTSINGGYFSKNFTYFDLGERFNFTHNSNFRLNNKWLFNLMNTYNQFNTYQFLLPSQNYAQKVFNNSIGASTSLSTHSNMGSSFFYNVSHDVFFDYTTHSRGLAFNFNHVVPPENLLFGFSSQFGYNRVVTTPGSPEKFFMSLFSIIKYRVYSFNVRYSNGLSNGAYSRQILGELYTQNFATSLNHQHQFRNRHFVLNNSLTYNLLPQIDRHSVGITPEMNYFTKDGWRFRVTAGYYFTSSRPNQFNPYKSFVSGKPEEEEERVTTRSYLLMFGIRKEFGIPLPFVKRRFPSIKFIAFADVNGNNRFDNDETRLENVVIGVNGWEIITDDKGEAQLRNVPEGEYAWQVFSLNDVQDYFPNIPDKINIVAADSLRKKLKSEFKVVAVPFVRGVKLYGKIYLDREKFSPDALQQVDLSGIRVSAVNGHKTVALTDKNGEFSFYLPYGEYVVSMDERVLGDRLRLLQNDIQVTLEKGIDNMFISFYLAENQRRIVRKRFDANGNLIPETGSGNGSGSGAGNSNKTETGNNNTASTTASGINTNKLSEANKNAGKTRTMTELMRELAVQNMEQANQTTGLIYTVQLGAFQKNASLSVFEGFTNLMYEVIDPNFVRISMGHYDTEADAVKLRDKIVSAGWPNAIVSVYYNGKNITLPEAAEIKRTLKK